jgi:hypothetical protein
MVAKNMLGFREEPKPRMRRGERAKLAEKPAKPARSGAMDVDKRSPPPKKAPRPLAPPPPSPAVKAEGTGAERPIAALPVIQTEMPPAEMEVVGTEGLLLDDDEEVEEEGEVPGDGEYVGLEEEDDEASIAAQEEVERAGYGEEMEMLKKEADMSPEELRRLYYGDGAPPEGEEGEEDEDEEVEDEGEEEEEEERGEPRVEWDDEEVEDEGDAVSGCATRGVPSFVRRSWRALRLEATGLYE